MLLKAWSLGLPVSDSPTAGPWALPWEPVQVAGVRRSAQRLQGQPCFSISRLHCLPEPQLPTCKTGESCFSHRETHERSLRSSPAQGQTLARPESNSSELGGEGWEGSQSVRCWLQGRTQESSRRSYRAPSQERRDRERPTARSRPPPWTPQALLPLPTGCGISAHLDIRGGWKGSYPGSMEKSQGIFDPQRCPENIA